MQKPANRYAIGLDIGGTKIAGGLVDDQGHVVSRQIIPTQAQRGGQPVLADALTLARSLYAEAQAQGWSIAGIGLAICELVDGQGNITSDDTVKWLGLPIQQIFGQLAPTVVEVDVRAHALAEARFGAGQPFHDFVFVTVGTGISSCLVLNGKPYAGARGNAVVLATMPITVFDERGHKIEFALEPFASGAGLVQRYQQHNAATTRVEQIVAAANAGEQVAATILQTGGEALGSAIAWLVNVLDPAAVIVGGGLGLAGGLYWAALVTACRTHIYAADSRELPILPAACSVDAGVIGAAARVFNG